MMGINIRAEELPMMLQVTRRATQTTQHHGILMANMDSWILMLDGDVHMMGRFNVYMSIVYVHVYHRYRQVPSSYYYIGPAEIANNTRQGSSLHTILSDRCSSIS